MPETPRPPWGAGVPATTPTTRSTAQPEPMSPALGVPVPGVEPLEIKDKSDLIREYVAGGSYSWYGNMVRALPPAIDDLTTDFGDDLYDRMENDPQISACMTILKAAILEDGLHLNPAVEDADDDDYDLAVEIFEEAEAMIDNLSDPLDDSLWDLLSCIGKGNRVAEQKIGWAKADKDGRKILNLEALKVKPRRATAFVIDPYLNVIGLLGRPPGFPSPFLASWLIDPSAPPPNLLPRSKFAVLTYRPKDSDPRGTSLLRPAYDPWWRKRQIIPEYLRYLTQFAGPSVWGTVPEKALPQPQLDANGQPIPGAPMLSPETVLFNALVALRNGTAGAFPFGTIINQLTPQAATGISPFAAAIASSNLEITKCILTQNLATEEGEHQARAAAQVHQDVLDTLVRQGKRSLVRVLIRDVLRPWISYNWGDKARKLAPQASLGVTEERDRGPLMTAISSLKSTGFLAPSQMQAIDEMLGLPVRTAEEAQPPVIMPPPPPGQPGQQPQQLGADGHPVDSKGAPAPANGTSPPSPTKSNPADGATTSPASTTPPETSKAGAPAPAKVAVPTSNGPVPVRPHERKRPTRRAKPTFAASLPAKFARADGPAGNPQADGGSGSQLVRPRGEPLARKVAGVTYTALDRWMMGEMWAQGVPEEYSRLLRAPVVRQHTPHPSADVGAR